MEHVALRKRAGQRAMKVSITTGARSFNHWLLYCEKFWSPQYKGYPNQTNSVSGALQQLDALDIWHVVRACCDRLMPATSLRAITSSFLNVSYYTFLLQSFQRSAQISLSLLSSFVSLYYNLAHSREPWARGLIMSVTFPLPRFVQRVK